MTGTITNMHMNKCYGGTTQSLESGVEMGSILFWKQVNRQCLSPRIFFSTELGINPTSHQVDMLGHTWGHTFSSEYSLYKYCWVAARDVLQSSVIELCCHKRVGKSRILLKVFIAGIEKPLWSASSLAFTLPDGNGCRFKLYFLLLYPDFNVFFCLI